MWIVPVSGILAVVVAAYLAWDVLGRDEGPDEMRAVASTIYEGAVAFLNRQYRTIALLSIVGAVGISALLGVMKGGAEGYSVAWHTGISFVIGAVCSGVAGLIGMFIAVKANLRTGGTDVAR